MEILNRTIPADRPNRPGTKYAKMSITIHETDNTSKGADALAHAGYISSTKDKVSWHYTVDDVRAVLHIPEDEIAWHSGTEKGNQSSIGIEICVNSDGDFEQAKRNAAELARNILNRYGWDVSHIKQHYDWNRKNCPKKLRKSGWAEFIEMCRTGGDAMYTKILKPDEISKIKLIRAANGKYESCESVKARTGADIVFNGSAYNMTSYAIDGALTVDGVVYGTGRVGLGFAFDGDKYVWSYLNNTKYPDFIGGYGLLVHNGVKKLVNPLNDRDARTALGITADNRLIIMVIGENSTDMCSTDQLADKMLAAGAVNAINLDGSYSSQVIAPGHTIESTRDVNNYICIWLTAQATPTQPHTDTLTAKCTAKVNTLGSTGKAEYGRYIAKGDVCKIYSTITPNLLIKVDYPTSAGMRTAYIRSLENFVKA